MSVTAGINFFELTEPLTKSLPEVTYFYTTTRAHESTEVVLEQVQEATTGNPTDCPEVQVHPNEGNEMGEEQVTTEDSNVGRERMDYRSNTEDDFCADMDLETASQSLSTLAQAFYCPTRMTEFSCPGDSSSEPSESHAPAASRPTPLASSSCAIIKQCFTETNPIVLQPAYPTVTFNQEQISSILRIVVDESARASFEILNSVLQRASKLSLHAYLELPPKRGTQTSLAPETDTDVEIDTVMTSDFHEESSSQGLPVTLRLLATSSPHLIYLLLPPRPPWGIQTVWPLHSRQDVPSWG